MIRQFYRIRKMKNCRLPKIILSWDQKVTSDHGIQTWYKEISMIHEEYSVPLPLRNIDVANINFDNLRSSMMLKQSYDLKTRCTMKPKLRLYNEIMDFGKTPTYLMIPLSFIQKSYLPKLRLSALPIRIETGRYERPKLDEKDRLCLTCNEANFVENENHFVFVCSNFNDLRTPWLDKIVKDENFNNLSVADKFNCIFNSKDNLKMTSQFLINCYDRRKRLTN